jgi:hypothetical protein
MELETVEPAGGRLSYGGHLPRLHDPACCPDLGRDEDLLWKLSDQLEPEDAKLWVYAIDGAETPAFTHDGIEALREIIKDQIDRAG